MRYILPTFCNEIAFVLDIIDQGLFGSVKENASEIKYPERKNQNKDDVYDIWQLTQTRTF
jgi:hypothetical protein